MKNQNKIIAEFMGWTFTKREDGNYDIKKDGVETWEVGTDADFKSGATYSGCFSYSEWNDIMPVKDKVIPLTDDLPPKYYDMIVNGLISGDRDQVYNSCVEVIKLTIKK